MSCLHLTCVKLLTCFKQQYLEHMHLYKFGIYMLLEITQASFVIRHVITSKPDHWTPHQYENRWFIIDPMDSDSKEGVVAVRTSNVRAGFDSLLKVC